MPPTTAATSSSAKELGSGTVFVPGALLPGVVPNENIALVTVVESVAPGTSSVNVAVWFRNGL